MKLTPAQWKMLDKICRTNGGGVFVGFSANSQAAKMMAKLQALGLIQGKSGDQSWAVHTKDGLNLWRARSRESEPARG